jgi:hypothetical protein
MSPRTRVSLFAAFAALCALAAAPAFAATVCHIYWRPGPGVRYPDGGQSLSDAKCVDGVLIAGGVKLWGSDSWSMFSADADCRNAAKGFQYFMDYGGKSADAKYGVELPATGVVIRGPGLKIYGYAGSCGSLEGKAHQFVDCREKCKVMDPDGENNATCEIGDKHMTCKVIFDDDHGGSLFGKSYDHEGNEELDEKQFLKDLIKVGEQRP